MIFEYSCNKQKLECEQGKNPGLAKNRGRSLITDGVAISYYKIKVITIMIRDFILGRKQRESIIPSVIQFNLWFWEDY